VWTSQKVTWTFNRK